MRGSKVPTPRERRKKSKPSAFFRGQRVKIPRESKTIPATVLRTKRRGKVVIVGRKERIEPKRVVKTTLLGLQRKAEALQARSRKGTLSIEEWNELHSLWQTLANTQYRRLKPIIHTKIERVNAKQVVIPTSQQPVRQHVSDITRRQNREKAHITKAVIELKQRRKFRRNSKRILRELARKGINPARLKQNSTRKRKKKAKQKKNVSDFF